ncbi:MAG: hypothetical protein OXC44_02125, partial [Proteobacteria bacterium]|nr:hypothetical protein [Pseudomonadota bacterium]
EVQSTGDDNDVTTNPNSGDGTADNNKPPTPTNGIVVIKDNTPPPRSQEPPPSPRSSDGGGSQCPENSYKPSLGMSINSWITRKIRGKRMNSNWFRVTFSTWVYGPRYGWTFNYIDFAKGKTDEDSDGKILHDERPRRIKEIFIAESFSCHKNAPANIKRSTPCDTRLRHKTYDNIVSVDHNWFQPIGFNRSSSLYSTHFKPNGSLDKFLTSYVTTKKRLNSCGTSESGTCSTQNNLPGVFIKIWQYGFDKKTRCAFPEESRWVQLPVDGVIALAELGGYQIADSFPWKSRPGYQSGKTLIRKLPIVGTSYFAVALRNWLKTQTDQDKERMLSQLKVLEQFAIEAYNYSEFEPPGSSLIIENPL